MRARASGPFVRSPIWGGGKGGGGGGGGRAGEGDVTGPASPGRKAPMPWGVARIAKIASAAATALIVSLGGSTHPAGFPRWDYTYATRGASEPFREIRQGLPRVVRFHDRGRQEDSDGPEFDRARDVSPRPHARPAEDLPLRG